VPGSDILEGESQIGFGPFTALVLPAWCLCCRGVDFWHSFDNFATPLVVEIVSFLECHFNLFMSDFCNLPPVNEMDQGPEMFQRAGRF
jgi:hypothetical protein